MKYLLTENVTVSPFITVDNSSSNAANIGKAISNNIVSYKNTDGKLLVLIKGYTNVDLDQFGLNHVSDSAAQSMLDSDEEIEFIELDKCLSSIYN